MSFYFHLSRRKKKGSKFQAAADGYYHEGVAVPASGQQLPEVRPRPHGGVGGYTAETRVTNRGQDNPGGGHEPGEEGSQGGESRDDAYGQGPDARPQ